MCMLFLIGGWHYINQYLAFVGLYLWWIEKEIAGHLRSQPLPSSIGETS